MAATADSSVTEFFADCGTTVPQDVTVRLKQFVERHTAASGGLARPIACVTSGGTTVPLERNCVRFIDNFSAGTRGALSTEQFLKAGYAVIFLTRTGSIQPFTQDLPLTETVPLLQSMLNVSSSSEQQQEGSSGSSYSLQEPAAGRVAGILRRVEEVQHSQLLLTIPFETIFEYLQYLKAIGEVLAPLGPQALFYLAAAVSDFYLPWSQLAEHKIQSADGPLVLQLEKVPKMLPVLRHVWAPSCMIVSFKLETDESILLTKASSALDKYAVHAVVANLLHTRKDRVLIVTKQQQGQPHVVDVRRAPEEPHIERQLVGEVVALHSAFRQQQPQQ